MAFVRQTIFVKGPGGTREAVNLMLSNLESFFDDVDAVTDEIAEELAKVVLYESQLRVPKDTGALLGSGKVTVQPTKRGKTAAVVSFGGDSPSGYVDYALFVHEDMPRGFTKSYTTPGTGPKYLEIGANAALPKLKTMMVTRYREKVK